MILMLFLYDPLYTSSHDLESDYPWSGLKDENSPTPHITRISGLRHPQNALPGDQNRPFTKPSTLLWFYRLEDKTDSSSFIYPP